MAKFVYNNVKNINTDYTFFQVNCGYYLQILYKEDINHCSKFKSADKLSIKLKKLINI